MKNLLFLFPVFFILIQMSSSFHWDGNILYDLESTNEPDFITEVSQWFLSNYITQGIKYYKCANDYVLGGFNVMGGVGFSGSNPYTGQYFERIYDSLPVHNQVYIQMRFFQIDSWDLNQVNGNDHFEIAVDGNVISGWDLSLDYSGASLICAISVYPDFIFVIALSYPHSASSLTLRMINQCNEESTNESMGFRDIKIEFLTNASPYFSLCAPGVPSSYLSASRCQTSCTSPGNSIIPVGYGFCFPPTCSSNCKRCSTTSTTCTSCPTGSFLVGTTCYPTCAFPLSTKLLAGVAYCETPCSSQYAWWDGTCNSACSYATSKSSYAIVGTTVSSFLECQYPCATDQYFYWNASCLSSCPSPLITTNYKDRQFCEYPCGSSDFLYWNGSCLSTCPSPLSSETQGTSQQRKFCWYPCSETQYLYWNESCISHCPSPLTSEIQGTSQPRNFCWYTCPETQFLYWNGSCIHDCPSPLTPEIQGAADLRNFCWYSCQPHEFLYWNGSCLNNCPVPLVSFDLSGNLFCFLPCSMPDIYWYQDLSCRLECNFPYLLVFHDSVQQCLKPCSRPSEYFYDLEKECHDTCDPPYIRQITNTIKVCHIDASTLSSEIDKIKSTVEIIETLGKITSGMIKAASIPQLSTPRSALLIQISAIMQYIRYMRINYPWRVQLLFQSNGADLISLSIDFSIPNKIQDKFDNYPLPDVFEKYSLDSNFINNMWDLMSSALLLIFGVIVLLILRKTIKSRPKVNHILTRVLQSLRWNILIAMISGGAGEIIFYASLQIRNTPLASAISVVSFLISVFMIFCVLVLLAICLKLLRGFHLQKQKITQAPSSENQDWLDKWKGYEILYEEIEEKYLFSLAYMVIYVIRAIFFFAIIANLYDYPLTQSILINMINLFIFLYLLCYKPLKDMWNTIQLLINEILGNIITICVLVLAIMDRAEIEGRYSRVTVGNVIIGVMLTFYILGVVFLVIEGVLFLIEAYKTWKEMRAKGIKNPFKMIQIMLFGETKTVNPEETTLELPQSSSRVDTFSLHTERNYLQKSNNDHRIGCDGEVKAKNTNITLDSSSRFFFPVRHVHPIGPQITESGIQNTEYEIETSQANKLIRRPDHSQIEQNEDLSRERVSDVNTPQLVLSATFEPILQPNVDFIQSWGNLKARMKRFNQSIHKVHWPHE